MWYKLVDKMPVECDVLDPDIRTGHRLGLTQLPDGGRVSTVFLGLDHRHGGEGEPILFESMYFTDKGWDEDCERYTTYEDALQGHWTMVEFHGGRKPLELHFDEDLFEI